MEAIKDHVNRYHKFSKELEEISNNPKLTKDFLEKTGIFGYGKVGSGIKFRPKGWYHE